MKSLVTYINENLRWVSVLTEENEKTTTRINDLQACWSIEDPENKDGLFVISIPKDYNKEEVSQYLSDLLLDNLPCDEDFATQYFQGNADNIIDAYIDIEDISELHDATKHITFEYDKSIGNDFNSVDEETINVVCKNVRLIIDFEYFDIINLSVNQTNSILWNIFKRTVSNNNTVYMDNKIHLSMEQKDLSYDENTIEIIQK